MRERRYTSPVFRLLLLTACASLIPGEDSATEEASTPGPGCPAEHPFPGSLTLRGPDSPASLAGLLQEFDGVEGSIFLSDWPDEDLTAFAGIRCIGGRLDVHSSPELRSFRGLDDLVHVTTIQLSNLPEVTTLDGLGALEEVEAFLIYDYDGKSGFQSLDGLEGLHTVQTLSISGPRELTQVNALRRLTEATDVSFVNLPGLTDLSGLGALTSVEGNLGIDRNDYLTTLAGFDALEFVGGDVYVGRNPALPQADAEAWVDAIDEVVGEVYVQENGP